MIVPRLPGLHRDVHLGADPSGRQPRRTDEQGRAIEPGITDDGVAAAGQDQQIPPISVDLSYDLPDFRFGGRLDDMPRRPAQPQRGVFSQTGSAIAHEVTLG